MADFKLEPAELAPVQTLLADYRENSPLSPPQITEGLTFWKKNKAKSALMTALRLFVKARLAYNPAVADTDRGNVGLSLHRKTRTPVPPPETYPKAEIDSPVIRRLTVRFKDTGRKRAGNRRVFSALESAGTFAPRRRPRVEELMASVFATTTPHTRIFSEKQRGQKAYFCLCWETQKEIDVRERNHKQDYAVIKNTTKPTITRRFVWRG